MADTAQVATFPFSLDAIKELTPTQKLMGGVAIAVAIAILFGIWTWSRSAEYSVLFSNISDQDGGQIVTSLQQMNVPYKFSDGGNAILVPSTQVHDIRLRLASQGLPKGGLVGFEVMENQKLGASQFLEQMNYQRALEGELARTIQTLQAVQAARVHLAIPKSSAFLRDEQKPTASVVLSLYQGRALDPGQVAGIVHLVASSVSQLTPANISVIDQNGNLLSQNTDNSRDASLDPTQLKYLRELEKSTIRRIETILEPVVGTGNVRAQVAADVDFSQTDQMAETYGPNPPPNTAIRSQQLAESGNAGPSAGGVPGALSNQPPVPATAPVTSPPVASPPNAAGTTATNTGTGTGTGTGGTTGNANNLANTTNGSRSSTTNYELDKTIRHTKGASGIIKRLSVAVVVNQKKTPPDKDGKSKSLPLTPEEIQQITNLVREAMGYNKDRGDTLNVANVSFTAGEKEIIEETPVWKDPAFLALGRESLKYLFVAIAAYLFWVRGIKPMFIAWVGAAEERRKALALENQVKEEIHEQTLAEPIRTYEDKVSEVRDLAAQNPKAVANIIKGWVNDNE